MGEESQKEYLINLKQRLESQINTFEENLKSPNNTEIESYQKDILENSIESLNTSIDYVDTMINKVDSNSYIPSTYLNIFVKKIDEFILGNNTKDTSNLNGIFDIYEATYKIEKILSEEVDKIKKKENFKESLHELDIARNERKALTDKVSELKVLIDDQKNKQIHKIFEDDSRKFKLIARSYEVAFYSIVIILILYFLGLTFYVADFNFLFIEAGFPEKIHGKLSPEFYIQKISLLVLSTTLAAFLLKRSFMNRRLADDAYRTSKELVALPRYMEGMPDEMQEKIRFDLAYKYFGNGIHHESYTGGENLMHENIKANTDFIKAVKDLTPKVEVPKAEAAKEQKPDKAEA